MEYYFIKSNKKADLLVSDSFIYRKKCAKNDVQYYYCIRDSCSASCRLRDGRLTLGNSRHDHLPEHQQLLHREQRALIKQVAAKEDLKTYNEIYN